MHICNQLYFSKSALLLLLLLCLALPFCGYGQSKAASPKQSKKPAKIDSISQKNDSALKQKSLKIDSVSQKNDSLAAPKQKSNQIDAEIVYSAQDSIVFWGNGTG